MNCEFQTSVDNNELKTLQGLFRKLIGHFPSSKISKDESKPDDQMIQDFKDYVQNMIDMVTQSKIQATGLDSTNDNAPLL